MRLGIHLELSSWVQTPTVVHIISAKVLQQERWLCTGREQGGACFGRARRVRGNDVTPTSSCCHWAFSLHSGSTRPRWLSSCSCEWVLGLEPTLFGVFPPPRCDMSHSVPLSFFVRDNIKTLSSQNTRRPRRHGGRSPDLFPRAGVGLNNVLQQ